MTIHPDLSLDALVATFTRGMHAQGEHSTPEHAGLAAVLLQLNDSAQYAIARDVERYDHRSLYEFAAAMRGTIQITKTAAVGCNQKESEASCLEKPDPKLTDSAPESAWPSTCSPEAKPAAKSPEPSTSPSARCTPGVSARPCNVPSTANNRI
jgi:hypothetical protein